MQKRFIRWVVVYRWGGKKRTMHKPSLDFLADAAARCASSFQAWFLKARTSSSISFANDVCEFRPNLFVARLLSTLVLPFKSPWHVFLPCLLKMFPFHCSLCKSLINLHKYKYEYKWRGFWNLGDWVLILHLSHYDKNVYRPKLDFSVEMWALGEFCSAWFCSWIW